MTEHTSKQFDADLEAIRSRVLQMGGFVEEQIVRAMRGFSDADMALIGFSQGTMVSLHVGLRRAKPCAGILGYSGRLEFPDMLASELKSRPPVMLVHGEADPVVPFAQLAAATEALKENGVPVEAHARPGLGHGIDIDGIKLGAAFLTTVLSGR